MTILTIFGTRPEVIKLFPVLEQFRQHPRFKSVVVSTSQHRQMIDDLLTLFSIHPDHDLNIIQANQTLADISTRALCGLDPLLKRHQPAMVLVQGDTTTAFIGALAAFYQKIPVGHVEAGLRSFDKMQPYPEEINRKMVSILSDLHFAPTLQNARHLYDEGVDQKKVFVTGNTVIDALLSTAKRGRSTLQCYLPMETLDSHRLVLVTAHRRENWGKPLENLCLALKDIVNSFHDVH
ncbi:MAG: non-hydrolyzing UDP-N-acetylglucosamine 2-epimerase, partial [bacterium]